MAELRESVAVVLDDVGLPEIEAAVSPEGAVSEVIGAGRADIDIGISILDGGHSSTFSVQDFGDPGDPELGTWITVTPWRDDLSIVLSIAVIIAAAKLTRAPVVDESQSMGGRRQAPGDLIEAIRRHPVEPAAPPAEKARALLRGFQPGLLTGG